MDKKQDLMALLLFLTGLICVGFLFLFGYSTYERILSTESELTAPMEQFNQRLQELQNAEEIFTKNVTEKETLIKHAQQKTDSRTNRSGNGHRRQIPPTDRRNLLSSAKQKASTLWQSIPDIKVNPLI